MALHDVVHQYRLVVEGIREVLGAHHIPRKPVEAQGLAIGCEDKRVSALAPALHSEGPPVRLIAFGKRTQARLERLPVFHVAHREAEVGVHRHASAARRAFLQRLAHATQAIAEGDGALVLGQRLFLEGRDQAAIEADEFAGSHSQGAFAGEPVPVKAGHVQPLVFPAVACLRPHAQLPVGDAVNGLIFHHGDESLQVIHGLRCV